MDHTGGVLDQVTWWVRLTAHLASASQGYHLFFSVFTDSDGAKKEKYCLVTRKPTISVDAGNRET